MSVAVVTGGASGLGAAIVTRLADDGFHVVVADVDQEAATDVASRVGGTAIAADVTDDGEVSALMTEAAALGSLGVLVLSAAVETRASVVDCSDDEWQRVLDVNLKGPFLCM